MKCMRSMIIAQLDFGRMWWTKQFTWKINAIAFYSKTLQEAWTNVKIMYIIWKFLVAKCMHTI
jgi:hypothetical protein